MGEILVLLTQFWDRVDTAGSKNWLEGRPSYDLRQELTHYQVADPAFSAVHRSQPGCGRGVSFHPHSESDPGSKSDSQRVLRGRRARAYPGGSSGSNHAPASVPMFAAIGASQ